MTMDTILYNMYFPSYQAPAWECARHQLCSTSCTLQTIVPGFFIHGWGFPKNSLRGCHSSRGISPGISSQDHTSALHLCNGSVTLPLIIKVCKILLLIPMDPTLSVLQHSQSQLKYTNDCYKTQPPKLGLSQLWVISAFLLTQNKISCILYF